MTATGSGAWQHRMVWFVLMIHAPACRFGRAPGDGLGSFPVDVDAPAPAQETPATTCAKICLCDSDCDSGKRCSTPLGSGGFKAGVAA